MNLKIVLVLIFLALVWGSSFILMKKGLESFSYFEVGALRMIIAGGCMLPFAYSYYPKVQKFEWKWMFLLGMVGSGIPAILFPLAETKINSATAGMLNSLTPMFSLLVGISAFGVPFSLKKTIGVVVGFLGAILLMFNGKHEANGEVVNLMDTLKYSGIIVFATFLYGLNVNLMKAKMNHASAMMTSTFSLIMVGALYAIYIFGFSDVPARLVASESARESFFFIFLLAALGTALCTVIFYRLVQWTDAIVAASVTYLMPIIALAWGVILSENINLWQVLGMAIVLVGVYLVNRKEAK